MKKLIAWILVLALCLSFALVGCAKKSEDTTTESGLDKAAKYLKALYNDASTAPSMDYVRTSVVPVGKVQYAVSWSVDVAEELVKIVPGTDNTVTIDINEDNQTETAYKLTATVSDADGNTKTVVFEYTLPIAVPKDGTEMSVKEIIEMGAAKEHDTYTEQKYKVTGIITEVYNTQYGNMYITDGEGNTLTIYGTYSADGTARYDAMEVKPVAGDTVTIYGIVGQYNSTPQIKNGWIVAHTPGDGTTPPVVVPDGEPAADSTLSIAEVIALGTSKDHNTYTAAKYYVTGTITEVYNTQYGNMYITDGDGNTLTIYGTYSADGTARYDAMTNAPVAGDTVTIYGVVGQYNGTPQIKNGWITSQTGNGGSTEPAPTDPSTDDPAADSTLSITEVIALGSSKEHNTYTTNKYYVTGTITEVYNTQYGNMYITDGDGNTLTIYGTYSADGTARYDAMTNAPVAGDTVTIYGVVGQYNGTPQIKNGWITSHTSNGGSSTNTPSTPSTDEPADGTVLSVKEAIAMGAAKEHNTYTTNKFKVTGVVTEVYNTQYGNMRIKDSDGNILTIYGTYSADGSTRYDAMTNAPVAGDTVTIYGVVGQYNDVPQIKNGWIVAHTPGEGVSNDTVDLSGAKATISFADVANRTSLSTDQQVWKQNGITVTNDQDASTAAIADYSNPARFYKSTLLTIEYTGMTKIAVTCNSYKTDYVTSLQTAAEAAGLTVTVSGQVVIIELPKAADSVSISLTAGQVRVDSIAVFTN